MLRHFSFDLYRAVLASALNKNLLYFLAHLQGSSLFIYLFIYLLLLFFFVGIEGV